LGEQDRMRGVMDDEQRKQVAASALTLVANLDASAQEEAEEAEAEEEEDQQAATASAEASPGKAASAKITAGKAAEGKANDRKAGDGKEPLSEEVDLPDGVGFSVLCAGGRGELDDAAAAMLAQVLEVQGAEVSRASFIDLEPAGIRRLDLS
ncbi:MAG: hypothetical protein E5W99_24435, partial [Mesorhizobium sp.]